MATGPIPRSRALEGALAGLLATALQTAVSRAVAPRLPAAARPPVFVPAEVVRWLRRRTGAPPLSPEAGRAGALLLHLAYGSLLGALYARSALPERLPAPVAGTVLGAAAWAAGFEGWIPALGILPRTTSRPPAQWVAPVLGHLLFGGTTAVLFAALRRLRT